MRRVRQLEFLFVLVVVLLDTVGASAQSFNGAITGVVKDSERCVVPDVALTLRNVATDEIVRHGRLRTPTANTPSATCRRRRTRCSHEGRLPDRVLPDIVVTLSSAVACGRGAAGRRRRETRRGGGGSSVLGTTGTQEHGIYAGDAQQAAADVRHRARVVGEASRC